MRLISCEIAGFGRISKLNIDFKDGINSWMEENGWGKTTFSVFLKSMFYGMEYSRKKTLSERDHYRPWEAANPYGGSVTFESDRGTYRIERFFGKKDTEDEFRLFDAKTGLLSEDYSSDIGQELFLVDRASFEKSIFIPQNSLSTGMTDSLNAKMGDMASAADDINNFDMAIRRLEDAKRIYTKNSRLDPGRLIAVRQDIRECREAAERIPAVGEALDKQRLVLEEKRELLREKRAQKEILKEQIKKQSIREQELGVYTEKKKTYNNSYKDFVELEKFFGSGDCSRDRLDSMDEVERRLEIDKEHVETLSARIPSDLIDYDRLDSWDAKSQRIFSLRLKGENTSMTEEENSILKELRSYFAVKNPGIEEFENALQDAAKLAQLEGQVEALNEQYRNASIRIELRRENDNDTRGPRGFLYGLLVAMVLAAGSLAFFVLFSGTSGRLFAAVTMIAAVFVIITVIYSLIRGRKERNERIRLAQEALLSIEEQREASIAERDRQREVCRSFLDGFLVSPADSYTQMIGEIQRKKEQFDRLAAREKQLMEDHSEVLEELSAMQLELYTELSGYAGIYGLDLYDEHRDGEVLALLREDLKEYSDYRQAQEEKLQLLDSIKEASLILDKFLEPFDVSDASYKEQLLEVRRNYDHIVALRKRLEGLKKDIVDFESRFNINEDTRSVTELQADEAEIDAAMVDLNEQLVKGTNAQNELSDELERLQENADRLEGLEELEAGYRKRTERIEKAIAYLIKAKESFLARYMGPLRKKMHHYIERVCGDGGDAGIGASDLTLDMDLGIRLDYNGSRKELEYLSSGYQDLLSVCARLALVDILYRDEKPFLILDDPFANLDEAKLAMALKLMESLGSERQIIYFTCHASRMM